jgi:hypothetical protein
MIKRYRDLLRVVVADLRHTLSGRPSAPNGGAGAQRGDLDRELERLGIAPDGAVTPFDALPNPTPVERRARRVAEAQLAAAPVAQRAATRAEIVERAAYTWINRLLALRAMEARGLINEILRSDPAYDGLSEALFILRQTQSQRATGPDGGWWAVIEDACGAQAASLPGLFDLADPAAALRPSTPALLRCVALIGTTPAGFTAEEADATFADPDAIGWAYQFYQEEAKARTYAKLNSGGKAATRAEIASVTQLFTEPYMVKWLLQNSLGRTYHELYPASRLPETWEYYIRDLPCDDADPGANLQSAICNLQSLTFMDPCMGSGHFEREAFDMVVAMYREQYPDMSATEIADRILTRHLHGIDLDPRAAQLAALTLYLRAWELIADDRRAKRLPGPGSYRPPAMNLATTPTGLTPGSLARHLQRHPEDRIYRPLLEGIFAALEQADVLGSLLRPGEQLDAAIRAFRTQGGGQLGLLAGDDDLNRLLDELARHDPNELKRMLLERVARSFATDAADADDVAMLLFGREAEEGLRLVELLGRAYVVVATNPPYADSANLEASVRRYLDDKYLPGRRNLYTAFLIWSLDHTQLGGYCASVAPQSYLFNSEYLDLRTRILEETSIVSIVSLGRYSFSEVDPPVNQVLAVFRCEPLVEKRFFTAIRISSPQSADEQAELIRRNINAPESGFLFRADQKGLASIPGKPVAYWVSPGILDLLQHKGQLSRFAQAREGLGTREDRRFIRYHWEVGSSRTCTQGDGHVERWSWCAKSGGYRKWAGLEWYMVEWEYDGSRIRAFPKSAVRNEQHYFTPGLTYSMMARGKLSVRQLRGAIFNDSAPSIFLFDVDTSAYMGVQAVLNSHLASYLMRLLTQSNQFRPGYLVRFPIELSIVRQLAWIGEIAYQVKNQLSEYEYVERRFVPSSILRADALRRLELAACALHTAEAMVELEVGRAYSLSDQDRVLVFTETGTPAGWHPFIVGYDTLPSLPDDLGLPLPPTKMLVELAAHQRFQPNSAELDRIKLNLRRLYEAGAGVNNDDLDLEELDHRDDEAVAGAKIPVPAETFLEELSQKLQIHPISVYWLLEELRAEGARCKPEELRLLEDRLSVLVLRLLGHRWPRQIEAGEPVPSWADPDGIIPLIPISGEVPLAERVRNRLRAEDGDRGAQQVEALLRELTGQTLEEWLRRSFFARHVRQFKHRPIAWHLASISHRSSPRRRGEAGRGAPAFECLLYYHACRGDVLARLRAHYVEPLIRLETAAAADARRRGDETAAAIAVSRVQELEEFATRLRGVEESGFACAELDRLLAGEALDRWSGDGIVPPASADELAAQERAWRVDINDGVRVNVAPLQLAGLLTGDVLRPDDARKAIADRARWRSDERRWVREGVLPRCGWLDEDVPESPRWTERAPEHEAEQRKLEEKRKEVMVRLKR